MIHFTVTLANPWSKRFETVFYRTGKALLPNKVWEIQFMKTNDIVSLSVEVRPNRDHAGARLEIGLIGYCLTVDVYDTRHR